MHQKTKSRGGARLLGLLLAVILLAGFCLVGTAMAVHSTGTVGTGYSGSYVTNWKQLYYGFF
ncbi:MAG: hypothetical protein A4E35_02191 [Methanoregula sp. PtaU1.Bin051]|nr:MAG: hypothetical protein A4E35_02191 [Methanoregula sp. PtaU1.Bin051]